MNARRSFGKPALLPLCLLAVAAGWKARAEEEHAVNFATEILPLLSKNCFACHGPDPAERKAKLRLDDRDAAIATGAIVPGKPEESEALLRVLSHESDELMPPPGKMAALSEPQKALLRKWIEQGAPYETHWAFVAPEARPVPTLTRESADFPVSSPLDAWVALSLEKRKIAPAPAAERELWLRRVTLDLTGLPPSLEEIDAFLMDTRPDAFEQVADRLLASSAFGERMAQDWLDVARYGDTYGRHEDWDCFTWPYRDWVIRAFNRNLPYDQFIIEQVAGDLLPQATQDQVIATAFNRLGLMTNEAGTNLDEARADLVADRVRTVGTAFLGLTMECSRCHDHKYDPISTKDYYSMAAYFDNIDELGVHGTVVNGVPSPTLPLLSDADQQTHRALLLRIQAKEAQLEREKEAARERYPLWLKTHLPPGDPAPTGLLASVSGWFVKPPETTPLPEPVLYLPFEELEDDRLTPNVADPSHPAEAMKKAKLIKGARGKALFFAEGKDNVFFVRNFGDFSRTDAFSISLWVRPEKVIEEGPLVHRTRSSVEAAHRGYELSLFDNHVEFRLSHFWPGEALGIRSGEALPVGEWTHLVATYDGSSRAEGLALYWNGEKAPITITASHLSKDIRYLPEWGDFDDDIVDDVKPNIDVPFAVGARYQSKSFMNGALDEVRVHDRALTAPEAATLHGSWQAGQRTGAWFDWYAHCVDEAFRKVEAELKDLRREENALVTHAPELMVMRERPERRQTHVLVRGQFDQAGEPVAPAPPLSLSSPAGEAPADRLGFARWLVARENPLTARVAVNRAWQIFFGTGLVSTAEDFGLQGELPSHPELLDWLALDFQEQGWNFKQLCRLIVLSSTYRQASLPRDAETLAQDPANRWLARGPRLRLSAEQLRDQALASAGLLTRSLGGPSVKPYQPAGLWEEGGTQHTYVQDHGEKLYRRSLYSFWRRTMPPPVLSVFDAPSREVCMARRGRTSNALQALAVLNDTQLVEAARCLSEKVCHALPSSATAADRISLLFRSLTGTLPGDEQLSVLLDSYAEMERLIEAKPDLAESLRTQVGEHPAASDLEARQTAALTLIARMLQGYDGCLSKL